MTVILRPAPPAPAAGVPAARTWPVVVLGLVATTSLVLAAGRAKTPVGTSIEAAFVGLLQPSTGSGTLSASVVLLSLAGLVACWWNVLRRAAHGTVGVRTVMWTAALWCLPLLASPPLLSLDAYAYLAQGEMLAQGLDPYSAGPVLLGDDPAAGRVDPMWRAAPVPYGPLTLVLLRAVALVSGDLTTGVLLLRAISVLGVAAAVGSALRLAPVERRAQVLAFCALNPVTLVHLVGGVHVDAVLAGVVGLSLLALRHDRPWVAWLLASSAVAVKVTAAPLLVFVLVVLVRRHRAWLVALPALLVAAVPWVASTAVVERPWGFLVALTVPGGAAQWYAPATVLGDVLTAVSAVLSVPVEAAVLRLLAQVTVLLIGALIVLALLRRAWEQSAQGPLPVVARAAEALLVAAVCLPALHGWYLAAGLFGVAALSSPAWTGVLAALCSALAFGSLPSLYAVDRPFIAAAAVGAVTILVLAFPRDLARRPAGWSGPAARHALATTPVRLPLSPLRLAQLGGAGLIVAATTGLLAPGAGAVGLDEQTQDERARLVRQVVADYPDLLVAGIARSTAPGADYDVQLVEPGRGTCSMRLRSLSDLPESRFVRVTVPEPDGRDTDAERVCPAPLPAAPPD